MTSRYKHTFEVYISLESGDENASDVTAKMLIDALQKHINTLKGIMTHSELLEEIGLFDTEEIPER